MNNLRELRRRAGFRRAEELASKAGVHPQTIYKIERGNSAPNTKTMQAIADVLAGRLKRSAPDVLAELLRDANQ